MTKEILYNSMGMHCGYVEDNGAYKSAFVNGVGLVASYNYGSRQTTYYNEAIRVTGQVSAYGDKCDYIANMLIESRNK